MEQSAEVPASPTDRTPRKPKGQPNVEGSVKDTIESILVAFILAFIFRAFIVEAFVIPTGSMAPTLLGAHMRFRCPDCGYRFQVNFQGTEQDGDDIRIPVTAGEGRTYNVSCPNCGFRVPPESTDDPENQATNPAVHYGDRILVLKYLYLFQQPQRWDVVVFKSPYARDRYDYSQNYIKRMVGKPGETVMILDGDVYVSPNDDPKSLQVQTKPRHVQDALWRIVYDNDYYPRGLARADNRENPERPFHQPWTQSTDKTSWDLGSNAPGNRLFTFSNLSGEAGLTFDPAANPGSYALTDWLAYDATENRGDYSPDNNVSDVKLSFVYHRQRGTGPLRAQLTKDDHTFDAVIADGSVSLLMDGKPLGGPVSLPNGSASIQVDVLNVDYRASVRIDGKEVLGSTPEQYHPDIGKLLDAFRSGRPMPKAQVKLIAKDQICTVSHVSLWRDIYYLNQGPPGQSMIRWATPANFPNQLMHLEKDQFFVLGDNSLVSLDARFWSEPIDLPREDLHVKAGVVPRRFMLGKAFFVYWPAGYRPFNLPVSLVPNFGDMRFIH